MPLPLLVNVRLFRRWELAEPVLAVAPGVEGRRLACADAAGGLSLWSPLQTLAPVKWETTPGVALFCLAWSSDDHILAAGSANGTIWLWESAQGTVLGRLRGHQDAVLGVSFHPGGRLLASCSADGTVRLWNLLSRVEIQQLPHPHTVCALHFTPDGHTLVAACEDGQIYLWSGPSRSVSQTIANPLPPVCLALSPDQRWLAWGMEPNALVLYERENRQSLPPLEGDKGEVRALSFSPDSQVLAAGSASGQVFFWDVAQRALGYAAHLHHDAVTSLGFVPSFQQERQWMLATSGEDGRACLWWVAVAE